MIDYTTAKKIRDLGFVQRRHDHAMYYVNENTIMYFEDIKNALNSNDWIERRQEYPVDWMQNFAYIPELVDLIGVESYKLTLDATVFHFIENNKSLDEIVQRTVEALDHRKAEEQLPRADKKTVVSDITLEGIEKIKEAINATQNPST